MILFRSFLSSWLRLSYLVLRCNTLFLKWNGFLSRAKTGRESSTGKFGNFKRFPLLTETITNIRGVWCWSIKYASSTENHPWICKIRLCYSYLPPVQSLYLIYQKGWPRDLVHDSQVWDPSTPRPIIQVGVPVTELVNVETFPTRMDQPLWETRHSVVLHLSLKSLPWNSYYFRSVKCKLRNSEVEYT